MPAELPTDLGVKPGSMPAPPPNSEPAGTSGPGEAPMMTPQPNTGEQLQADVQVGMITDSLLMLASQIGATTPKGRAILEAAQKLTKEFGGAPSKASAAQKSEQDNLMALSQLMSAQKQTPPSQGASPMASPVG